jgi:hypothetical protein
MTYFGTSSEQGTHFSKKFLLKMSYIDGKIKLNIQSNLRVMTLGDGHNDHAAMPAGKFGI